MASEELFRKLSASDLSAIILKGSSSSNDRDTGFCSGSSEGGDDLCMDHSRLEPRSPTDASEDSVEVKVTPICFTRNKRKSTEPSRVICEQETGPLKKRIRYTCNDDYININDNKKLIKNESTTISLEGKNHFRPWDQQNQFSLPHENMPNPAEILIRHPGVTTLHRAVIVDNVQEEPLALIAKKPSSSSSLSVINDSGSEIKRNKKVPSNTDIINNVKRISKLNYSSNDNLIDSETIPLPINHNNNSNNINNSNKNCNSSLLTLSTSPPSVPMSNSSSSASTCSQQNQRPQQRNYKNMTRERRIEANARERTRVHTISAAYDTLRKSIPSYSHTQKLSKLSVLRVACSYILTLSRMAGQDYSEDQSSPSISECFDAVTRTIQTEGKIRKKKDE